MPGASCPRPGFRQIDMVCNSTERSCIICANRSQIAEVTMRSKGVWIRLAVVAGLVGSLLLVGSAFAQGGTVVRIDPASAAIAQGQTVTVSVKIDNVSNMIGAE